MNSYSEYQELAMRTHNHGLSLTEARACYGMGLAGEAGEAADYLKSLLFTDRLAQHTLVLKELGDVHWYTVALAKMFDINADDIAPIGETFNGPHPLTENEKRVYYAMSLAGAAGTACDYVKKVLYHGHAFDRSRLVALLGRVRWCNLLTAGQFGASEMDVIEANVAKLRARYPDGFSKAASQNRAAGDV